MSINVTDLSITSESVLNGNSNSYINMLTVCTYVHTHTNALPVHHTPTYEIILTYLNTPAI